MPRSVNAVASRARRKKILKLAKGYFGRRKNVWTVAKNAVEKALLYAYRDRRNKKRSFRALWITRINAGARLHGMSYSQFMGKLNANNIALNRKVLADLAMNHPEAFKAVVEKVNKTLNRHIVIRRSSKGIVRINAWRFEWLVGVYFWLELHGCIKRVQVIKLTYRPNKFQSNAI